VGYDSLAPGETATLTLTGILNSSVAGSDIINQINGTQTEYPFEVSVLNSTIHVKKANVVLNQTGSYNKNNVTFIVTARNNGPDTATEINISNVIPSGLSNVTVTPSVSLWIFLCIIILGIIFLLRRSIRILMLMVMCRFSC